MNAADRLRWESQWTEAAKEYQRALAEFPDDTGARGGLGFCYMQTKQWRQALDEYEQVLKQEPSNIIPLSKTAELYVILDRREDGYKAYLHLADLYSQAGQGPRAEAMWQKAAQLSATAPEPHERLAIYYASKKDYAAMVQERLTAAQGYLLRNDNVSAQMQCEEVLLVDAANAQAQQLLSQLSGRARPAQTSPETAEGSAANKVSLSNISGGNTGMMGNMGSAGNFNGGSVPGPALAAAGTAGGGMPPTPRKRITAGQVAGVLRQAQTFQSQGRFTDAIDLCEQIIESGFDRADARYFLGWLYQEQRRWDDAIRQFQALLNDPDYALSCFYALGQCCRAKGDLSAAAKNFDEAVDRVNLDALTTEESDQLVQLCQEAAEAHRMLGEQAQTMNIYNALLGFLRNRGWSDKVAQVEFMLKQAQNTPAPQPSSTPLPLAQQGNTTRVLSPEQMTMGQNGQPFMPVQPEQTGAAYGQDEATVVFSREAKPPSAPLPPTSFNALGELPGWLTGILNEADKTQMANKLQTPAPAQPTQSSIANQQTNAQAPVANQPIIAQPPMPAANAGNAPAAEVSATWMIDGAPAAPPAPPMQAANTTQVLPPEQMAAPTVTGTQTEMASANTMAPVAPIAPPPPQPPQLPAQLEPSTEQPAPIAPPPPGLALQQAVPLTQVPVPTPEAQPVVSPVIQAPLTPSAEEMLQQMAGLSGKDGVLKNVADSLLVSTANLPEQVRVQVLQAMQDIQRYIDHGLLTPATEECLKIINIAPQYLDIHQVLCEIYVRQGKVEQAVTKYGILIDTYVVNGRIDDAIATYRRILQLEPNNLTYRVRLINLLATHGNKEDLLRERSLAAESYLRLGYMDRALTELEQALQESPTSVSTRLNYALALQKLGRTQQAVAEYQRVLQVDPRNLTALVRWHIAMITGVNASRATTLEILSRIRWQLRGEGQKHFEAVMREYNIAAETYPNNFDVRFAQGQLYQQAGNYDRAIDAFQLATRDSSYEIMARASAAQCLLTQGKPEAAIQQLEQALQSARTNARGSLDPAVWAARPREDGEEHQAPEVEISLMLAKAYGRVGKQEQMQEILRQLKQSTPQRDEVTSTLAEISARQGDLNGALQEYTDLAKQYRSKRQPDNALSVLHEMIRIAPRDPRAHTELADLYISRGHLDDGLAELRLLADIYLRSDDLAQAGETLRRIANISGELDNQDDAFMYYRRATELLPGDMDLLREVVSFCWQAGRNKEAIYYQEIIARHYFDTRQVKESVAALQQLIALDRTNLAAYDMLGQTYQSVGEYEQANRVYKNLAKVDPNGSTAKERLADLQELRAKTV
jgi:tetratricopeptide (TPR) repeat protein